MTRRRSGAEVIGRHAKRWLAKRRCARGGEPAPTEGSWDRLLRLRRTVKRVEERHWAAAEARKGAHVQAAKAKRRRKAEVVRAEAAARAAEEARKESERNRPAALRLQLWVRRGILPRRHARKASASQATSSALVKQLIGAGLHEL